jgi:hypothetical protein
LREIVGWQRQQLPLGQGLGAGRALVAVEHRQLAEDLAGTEGGEGDRTAVGVFAGDAEAAVLDDVAGVGIVALVEDPGPGREGPRHGDVREALQLPLLQVGEERHAPQQLDRALICLRHYADYGNGLAGGPNSVRSAASQPLAEQRIEQIRVPVLVLADELLIGHKAQKGVAEA